MKISIKVHTGNEATNYIDLISNMRINTFKEYPYLYKGTYDYEKQYLQGFIKDEKSTIAIAMHNNKIIGISTGLPLESESDIVYEVKDIFYKNYILIENYYYYGEIIILPEYRGQGLAKKLYSAQDSLIKSWGFKNTCILTVRREENHPLKPINYPPQDKMWEHLGFIRTNLTTQYSWPTIQIDNDVCDCVHTLELWSKHLPL